MIVDLLLNRLAFSRRDLQMVEANSRCPKCDAGTMRLVPEKRAIAPDLPEENKLKASCDKCGYQDHVEVVATDE
jgi:predicted Zn-ribbon and HTH transcriptional regulator